MFTEEDKNWILFNTFPKFGPKRTAELLNNFNSIQTIKEASIEKLIEAGIEKKLAEEFKNHCRTTDPEKIIDVLTKEDINILKITDSNYPELLKHIHDPPPLLYYKGNWETGKGVPLAVIGSRKHSYYGEQIVSSMIPTLAENDITIISGMALGIDALAHKNALKAEGRTWAIVGSGLDKNNIYPPQNRDLFSRIINSGGAVISEFPPGTPPLKQNFPQRNRIISGLSLGVFIVEATTRSGTLITCKQALEQGREIFAAPGNIYSPTSTGTNKLLKQGAHVVTNAEDILEIFDIDPGRGGSENNQNKQEQYSPQEQKILDCLSQEPTPFNDVVRLTKLDTSTVNSTLTVLEIRGIIKDVGGKKYVLNNN